MEGKKKRQENTAGKAEAWKCCSPKKHAQRLALCQRRTEKGGSVPALWTPKNFLKKYIFFCGGVDFFSQEGEEQQKKKEKFWQSTMQRYREGAALYKKRTHGLWGLPAAGLGWA